MIISGQFTADPQICRQCRGLCCQGHPGLWTDPEFFFSLFLPGRPLILTELNQQLASHNLTLRNLDGVLIPAPLNTPSGCIFHGAAGCKLPTHRRPDQCRALIPSIDTLIDGEMRCNLPPEHGSGTARKRWRQFWARHRELSSTDQIA